MNKTIIIFTCCIAILNACQPRITGTVRDITEGDSLSFIVLGDWGVNGSVAQRSVADQVDIVSRKSNVQFIITTGDNFYPAGVRSVTDSHWQRSFEKVYDKKGHMVPWFPTLGNHDYNGSPAAQLAYSKQSKRWQFPSTYYSFQKKAGNASVVFAFADMNPFITPYYKNNMPELKYQDTAAQYQWLQQTLSSQADWKIMIGHQPLYSFGSHGSSRELINRFKPLLLQTGTQFYLAGHDHNLQHIQQPNEPVHYLVSGGGGRGLYGLKNTDNTAKFAASSHGFLLMTVYAEKVNISFYDEKGNVMHQYQVKK